jgi:glycine dehydrogenase
MAGMYAVYHGANGLRDIASEIAGKATYLKKALINGGVDVISQSIFDTIAIRCDKEEKEKIRRKALGLGINFFYAENRILISIDETTLNEDLIKILDAFGVIAPDIHSIQQNEIPPALGRTSKYLTHPVYNKYQTETRLMRYIKSLENKDLSLMHAMIPLGSCTMKLNAASQLIPVTWPKVSHIHPFVPKDQVGGYLEIIDELAADLCEITGFSHCSFQPNSGAQGEYTGLLVIKAYHEDRRQVERNVTLIPSSAHGTNPASAIMAGMNVVIVKCDDGGNIDMDDLRSKAEQFKSQLAALMITYPSTHGVFEENIIEICQIIHDFGGLVYMDGANMNAQVGFTNPGIIGADVCHLNLHKTFAIPHGGGGPGMGPICVNKKLAPYLPGHIFESDNHPKAIGAVSSAHYGSASILLISYAYIKMLGKAGLKYATVAAIVNANYIRARLSPYYKVLYVGARGFSAHELIIDIRPFKEAGIDAEDVAKRLIDFGFHAPTLSFPVAGTLMIEPTESEDLEELDMFCEAMIEIRKEIEEVRQGTYDAHDNVLVNAPHTVETIAQDQWPYPYSREKAVYPLPWLRKTHKFWPPVSRVDNAYGDRNLICTCPPVEAYMDSNMVEGS